ncbi:YppG family protein [Bacillus lumedeiriae]|uniref:YppG family protein n=1 Tax=Bacillus lumedeiriae TaxID=3058829 RepID=UPI00384B3564
MRPYRPFPPRRPARGPQTSATANVMSLFQNSNGNLDIEKIMGTAQQLYKIQSQISPFISMFTKK